MTHAATHPIDAALAVGLKDLWFPVCPSGFVKGNPMSLRRLGYKIVLWRDASGQVHALEVHCPHRGAPLSLGVNLGDRIGCVYHGVQVRRDGTVTRVVVPGVAHFSVRPQVPTASKNGMRIEWKPAFMYTVPVFSE